jgi:hypothetical protein
MLILFALLSLIWLFVAVVVLAVCRMAAPGDAGPAQSPRRPRTWGTVRRRILTSPHSDRLVTYR